MLTAAECESDFKTVIESLASKNAAPAAIRYGDGGAPLFSENYDWSEYGRVANLIGFLRRNAEVAWPELLRHFDDRRYCISLASEAFESGRNYNVGEICQALIRNQLTAAFSRHMYLLRIDKDSYEAIRRPAIFRKPEDLRAWCEKRRGKQLFELQVEMCDWALKQASALDVDSRKSAFTEALRFEIDSLRLSWTALGCEWYSGGPWSEVFLYDAGQAEKIRGWYLRQKAVK